MATKIKLARSLRSKKEIKNHTSIFDTKGWRLRKEAIAGRVARKQEASHARAVIRKETAKPKTHTKREINAARDLVKKIEKRKARNAKHAKKK